MSQRSVDLSIVGGQDSARYKQCLRKLSKVMDVVQSDEYMTGKGKLFEKLKTKAIDETEKIFLESGLKIFSETLMRVMLIPFQSKENNPFLAKMMEFFFDLLRDERWMSEEFTSSQDPNQTLNTTINSVSSVVSSCISIMDEGVEPLPMRILKLCTKHHQEGRAIVRQRLMQTIEKIIPDVIKVENIPRQWQQKLIRMLSIRRKDRIEQVRGLALRNLCQFHKPGLPFQRQIEDDLLHHMSYDPEPAVRLKVVRNITIYDNFREHFVERTGDPHDSVRAAALERVAKDIPLIKLTPQLRETILRANTSEDNSSVVQKAVNTLLRSWLEYCNNNPCEFLRVLNVRRRRKLCRSALDFLFNESSQEAFEKMRRPLLNDKNYPDESLCVEITFLWLYMYDRFKDETYIMKKLTLSVNEMIEYIDEFFDVVEEEGEMTPDDVAYRCCMLGDMLQILCYLPVEEGERQAVLEFLPVLFLKKKLMDIRNSTLGVKLIAACSNIEDETHLIDLVNTVLDSDRVSTRSSRTSGRNLQQNPDAVDDPATIKLELGNMIHRLKKLERERDAAARDDLPKAQACQDEIRKVEHEIQQTKARIQEQEPEDVYSSANTSLAEDDDGANGPWIYSDDTMRITMALVKENIERTNKVSLFTQTFYDLYVLKALGKCKDPTLRALALELVCMVGLELEKESARATVYGPMALLRDNLIVKISALKCLFDLVLKYSFAKLGGAPEVQNALLGLDTIRNTRNSKIDPDDVGPSTFRQLLLTYIRHDEKPLVKVGVAGVLKLLFKPDLKISRQNILTVFVTHWAIPSHEIRLRFKDVGVMVPVYAAMGENEAIEVAQCLVRCFSKTLTQMYSKAAGTHDMAHSDLDQIANLIVKCTHPSKLTHFQRPYIGHQTIALNALEELQKDLMNEEKLHYAKLFKVLDLSLCPPESVRQMIHCLTELEETNRRVSLILCGFKSHLESLIADAVSDDGEEGEGETGSVTLMPEPMAVDEEPATAGPFDNDNDEGNED